MRDDTTLNATRIGSGTRGGRRGHLAGAAAALMVLLIAAGCARAPTPELARNELFTLRIGPLDEQIDLFRLASAPAPDATNLYMRDGLFYIANGNAEKVMQLSSYGDLILLLYDPDSNPEPVGLAPPPAGGGDAVTRLAVPQPFNELGPLAVDSLRRIHVVESVGDRRAIYDEQLGVVLKRVVQRFSRRGEHLDFIGQEGIGGTPFPFIHRLTITDSDELVVVTRTPAQWLTFWYDSAGRLQHLIELPVAGAVGDEPALVVWDVFPQLRGRQLMLFVDVGTTEPRPGAPGGQRNQSDQPRRGVRLYDLASASVAGSFELPDPGTVRGRNGVDEIEQPAVAYHPLGVTSEGALFLTRREDAQSHSLIVLGRSGRVVTRRLLKLDDSQLAYASLGMTGSGVLFGLLAESEQAHVVWWRGDLLLSGAARADA